MFAVRCRTPQGEQELGSRIAALERFYGPLGLDPFTVEHVAAPGVTVGALGPADPSTRLLVWNAPFGVLGPDADGVLSATDEHLRDAVAGFGLAIAWSAAAVRILTAPCGPVGGYTAASERFEAWATHAVAAAWLAHGRADIDEEAIPELLSFDFVGGGRSLVTGARPLPAATCVDVTAGTEVTRSWWPAAQRWAAVPEPDAGAHAEAALLRSLEQRVDGSAGVGLCLTAGADSRVLAVALREMGARVSAVTWGEPGWADAVGAEEIAHDLGIDWALRLQWRDDAELVALARADARWSDGAFGLAPSDRSWPEGTRGVMVGAAGEVGRAFYYRRVADREPPRSPDALADALYPEARLGPAPPEAQDLARRAALRWVDAALESGQEGWRALDVLYAEQRVAHWGRSQVPRLPAEFLAGFASAEVLRGLASLPLVDRLYDGFHRRFVAARRPDLALPVPAAPVPPAPPPGRLRGLRGRARRRPPSPPPPGDAFLVEVWAARPQARTHVADDVLRSSVMARSMGERWCEETRAGFLRGDRRSSQHALLASGPVALSEALRELQPL